MTALDLLARAFELTAAGTCLFVLVQALRHPPETPDPMDGAREHIQREWRKS